MTSSEPLIRTGLTITRRNTTAGIDPFEQFRWVNRSSRITNPDGSIIFDMPVVEVPEHWTQTAVDILAAKYLHKAGVPQHDEHGVPLLDGSGKPVLGAENSMKQVAHRMALAWKVWGESGGYFASEQDAHAYYDEMVYILCRQDGAPNSPQWFNTGLFEAYNIIAEPEGNWYYDPETDKCVESPHKYFRAGASACYILSVEDKLVGPGSIMDLWEREARLFKSGSGAGSNFSNLRANKERLSAGGTSSGLMSWLRIGDRAAGAIKSAGTTRRAAKMVIVDADHPDIEEFIWCKVLEEKKVAALVAAGYSSDFNGEAYDTVSFQNANHTVRLPAGFLDAVEHDLMWELKARTDGHVTKTVKARDLWSEIAEAAWQCADPGVQFDDVINDWGTASNDGRIRGSNPCSEYLFLDDTSCNLASLNLGAYFNSDTQTFDVESFLYSVRLWTITLEITVAMSHYPSADIAKNSFEHRTLGLGYANLGAILMRAGLAYDSDEARVAAAAITALLHLEAYATSAEIASAIGPCWSWSRNVEPMSRVLRNHRRAAYGTLASRHGVPDFEQLSVRPVELDHSILTRTVFGPLSKAVLKVADASQAGIAGAGYRNMQVTVLAPTGCVVDDTLVLTDRGLVRLNTVGNPHGGTWQNTSIDVQTDDGPRAASQFYVNGLADVARVSTRRGYSISGTPQHQVRVVDTDGSWLWKRLADLQASDVVPLKLGGMIGTPHPVSLPPAPEAYWAGPDHWMETPSVVTPELAELVGYFMGDGSLHSRGLRLEVAHTDPDVIGRLSFLAKQLFGIEAKSVPGKGNSTSVYISSVRLAMWWDACGFAKGRPAGHVGKGLTPRTPDAVLWTNDPIIYTSYLRGLFEADGTVVVREQEGVTQAVSLSMSTAHAAFADETQALLLALGIPSFQGHTIGGISGKPVTTVRVSGTPYSGIFAEQVGFMSARKQALVLNYAQRQAAKKDYVPLTRELLDEIAPATHWAHGGKNELSELRQTALLHLNRHSGLVGRRVVQELFDATGDARLEHALGFFYDTVADIKLGEGQVLTLDLSVPDNVTYVASGFVSHNTIGLVMDCDTTGVEPDFSLIKTKKLAGGGYMRIINESVEPALKALGYDEGAVQRMMAHLFGTLSLNSSAAVNRGRLTAAGLDALTIDRAERELSMAFDLPGVFEQNVIGEDVYRRVGAQDTTNGTEFLLKIGFTRDEIEASGKTLLGHGTLEGAADLRPEHQSVFDCAVTTGDGTRSIAWQGHVRMLGATAPFLSGGASKTVNLPAEATVTDVRDAYELAYELSVKCVAIYRDGSKMSQPLNAGTGEGEDTLHLPLTVPAGVSPTEYYQGHRPPKFRLPSLVYGPRWKFNVGGTDMYLRASEYPDGTLGEFFIDLSKEGSTLKGVLSCLAIAVSKGLQRGVPLEEFVETFRGHSFEPQGIVAGHQNLKMATSILDAMFRILGAYYLGRDDLVQIKGGPYSKAVTDGHATGDAYAATAAAAADSTTAAIVASATILPVGSERVDPTETCSSCGSNKLVRSGTCKTCQNCGNTTGCS